MSGGKLVYPIFSPDSLSILGGPSLEWKAVLGRAALPGGRGDTHTLGGQVGGRGLPAPQGLPHSLQGQLLVPVQREERAVPPVAGVRGLEPLHQSVESAGTPSGHGRGHRTRPDKKPSDPFLAASFPLQHPKHASHQRVPPRASKLIFEYRQTASQKPELSRSRS